MKIVWVVAAFLAISGVAQGATYYVSPAGNDGSSCSAALSLSTPKKTINGGVGCLIAGDTLYVRAGTYAESLIRNIPSGTSWLSKVRVAAYPGETVWMRPSSSAGRVLDFDLAQHYIEIDGINLDGTNVQYETVKITDGFTGEQAHHIRLQNLESISANISFQSQNISVQTGSSATSNGGNEFINLTVHGASADDFGHGFYIAASNTVIENCDIYGFHGAGITIQGNFTSAANNVVRNNRIHDAVGSVGGGDRRWGIVVGSGSSGNMVYNNVVYNIPLGASQAGIHVYTGNNTAIYNNTVYNVASKGILIENGAGNIVKNNIAYRNGNNYTDAGVNTVSSNNSVSGIDPRFVDPTRGNFQIQSGSPVIDAAVAISVVTTDLTGSPRPQGPAYDIGAYEFTTATQSQAPAPPTGVRIVSN